MAKTGKHAPTWLAAAPAMFVGLWATGFIGSRLSAPYAEPLSFLTIRFAIVAAILLAASLLLRASWPDRGTAAWSLATGGLMQGGYLGGVFWAIAHGMPAGVAALITALQPMISSFMARAMLGEQLSTRHWIGVGLGTIGVAMVVWPKLTLDAAGINPATLFAVMLGTFSISLGTIIQKSHSGATDMRTGNFYQFTGGAFVVGTGALMMENFSITWNGDVILAMAWLVLALSVGAISLLYLMIRHGEVARITGLFFLVPAVTTIIAWVWFGETLSLLQLAGMAVCSTGVLLVTRRA